MKQKSTQHHRTLHFYKMHGAGNDFVLIDNRQRVFQAEDQPLIPHICAFHFGVGADGLLLLEDSPKADFSVRYFNADGSRAALCANGARCAVKLAHHLGMCPEECRFEFEGTIYSGRMISATEIQLTFPIPRMVKTPGEILPILSDEFKGGALIDSGVPHLILVYDGNFPSLNVPHWGRFFRNHPAFQPEGTNVNFIQQLNEHHLLIRTYERGVEGETLACGTGALAASYFALKVMKWSPPIVLHAPGGSLQVAFNETRSAFLLTGPVAMAFEGDLNMDYFRERQRLNESVDEPHA